MLTPDDVHQLATDGAKLEIVRLEQRLAELRAEFPAAALALDGAKPRNGHATTIGAELRRRAAAVALEAPTAPTTKPPRPPMSAKARAAIGRAQRARWRHIRNGKH